MQGSFSFKVSKCIAENKFTKYTWGIITGFFKKIFSVNINKILGQLVRNRLSKKTKTNPNKIFFCSFQGDYTCNPKYITEELLKRGTNAEIVWAGRKQSRNTPGHFPFGIKLVDIYSYEMMKEIAEAKIIVTNSVEYQKKRLPIRNDQIVFQTWHGSLGIKRFDKEHNSGKAWVKAAEYNGKTTNYCLSNSKFENNVYRNSFWPTSSILEYGHPRNDILIKKDSNEAKKTANAVRRRLGIPNDVKVVLYGPTFRDSHNFDCYNICPEMLLKALKDRFGGDWILLTRYHPTVRKTGSGIKGEYGTINVSSYPDIQELMLISDIAITDYSSWIYDFILTGRPGFIFATDINSYYNERGFYYPLESTPFLIAKNATELANNIRSFNENKYSEKLSSFIADQGCFERGDASKKVVDLIQEIMEYQK